MSTTWQWAVAAMTEFRPRDFRRGLRHAGLTHGEFRVAVELCEYAAVDKPFAWPSVETLADTCDMTQRGVQIVLKRLEEKGVVVCIARTKGGRTQGGHGRTNRWELLVKTPNDSSGYGGHYPRTTVQGLGPETPNETANKPRTKRHETPNPGSGEVVRSSKREVGAGASAAHQPPRHLHALENPAAWVEGRFGPRCTDPEHVDHPNPPGCRGCELARKSHAAQTAAAQEVSSAKKAERAVLIANCPDCKGNHWMLAPDGTTPVEPAQRCYHRQDRRAAR